MIPDADHRKPLYLRIRDLLRERLLQGEWTEGDALPPRRALSLELGTTPVTLEKAISELVREGLLDVAVGSGTYVRRHESGGGSTMLLPGQTTRLGIVFGFHTRFVDDTGLAETDAYVGGLLRGIRSVLSERDVATTFFSVGDGNYQALADRPVDSALIIAPNLHALLRLQDVVQRLPAVVLGASTDYLRGPHPIPCVDSANVDGAYHSVRHLIELGHRRIAIICVCMENSNYYDRIQGYLRAYAEAGLTVDPNDLILFPAGQDGDCERLVEEWLERGMSSLRMPTAVLICDLGTTLLALKAFRRRGISIPEDLSVIAFDDSPLFDHTAPPVTAVRQPLFEMGRRATERLLDRFKNGSVLPDQAGVELFPTPLIVRKSTGPPRPS